MDKTRYIKSLPAVKLIIGNGFDLHCGLHSKYSDYYCKYFLKYERINSIYKEFLKTHNSDLALSDELLLKNNIWDIFFAFNSKPIRENVKKNGVILRH